MLTAVLMDADLGLANVDVLLGLTPKRTLADVIAGECDLRDVLLQGPGGVRIVPGRPDDSLLLARMKSSNPYQRIPPLGTRIVDREAVALIELWIKQLQTLQENDK